VQAIGLDVVMAGLRKADEAARSAYETGAAAYHAAAKETSK
jgi:hypothetical protein